MGLPDLPSAQKCLEDCPGCTPTEADGPFGPDGKPLGKDCHHDTAECRCCRGGAEVPCVCEACVPDLEDLW